MAIVSENLYNINTGILPKDACIVIVHTQWNPAIVNKLLEGCLGVLHQYELKNYKIVSVPGVFELPFTVKNIWETYRNKFDKPKVFITLGCVMRGETPHFEFVCQAATQGILELNMRLPVPTIFGILTVDNQTQADERTGGVHGHKGEEAALTALKMMELKYTQ